MLEVIEDFTEITYWWGMETISIYLLFWFIYDKWYWWWIRRRNRNFLKLITKIRKGMENEYSIDPAFKEKDEVFELRKQVRKMDKECEEYLNENKYNNSLIEGLVSENAELKKEVRYLNEIIEKLESGLCPSCSKY